MRIYGVIYLIRNNVNNKVYIGQTINGFNGRYSHNGNGIERVYKYHKSQQEQGRHYNKHLFSSIEKYGFDNFEIDEEFDVAYNKEDLDTLEDIYIKAYNSIDKKYGYNHKKGGANGKLSVETRMKISESRTGIYCGENHPMYGKTHLEETKKKISKSRKGKTAGENNPMYGVSLVPWNKGIKTGEMKEETKKKISDTLKGHASWNKGRIVSEETKKKMSEANKGIKNSNARKVICLNDLKVFDTSSECCKYYGCSPSSVSNCCNGKIKSTKGYMFAFYDMYLEEAS